MSKMGFGMWHDGGNPSCYVAPKKDYDSSDEFELECERESDGFYEIGPAYERHARWFPVAPEGIDIDDGCYSFCSPGRGAFPVWVVDVKEKSVSALETTRMSSEEGAL
ncbi:hypothetical protein [Paenibacillus amylolyticus]|uniref:Uncharacterized protein n=1 Tax=Paenibacillus amylolyticus TaxID=1451 RepID=A0ABD8B2R9_PAEAM